MRLAWCAAISRSVSSRVTRAIRRGTISLNSPAPVPSNVTKETLTLYDPDEESVMVEVFRFKNLATAFHELFEHWMIIDVMAGKIIAGDALQFHNAEDAAAFMIEVDPITDNWISSNKNHEKRRETIRTIKEAAKKHNSCAAALGMQIMKWFEDAGGSDEIH